MNLYEKIQKAKELILEANLKKSGKNKFAGYSYYELSDILPTIIKVCNELKLFTQIQFNNEYAVLNIVDIEKPEEIMSYTSPMKELSLKGANEIQALGGTQTYQRRYLYMCAFDIIENDMFDATIHEEPKTLPKKEKPAQQTSDKPITENSMAQLTKVINKYSEKTGKDVNQLKAHFCKVMKVESLEKLTEAQATVLIPKIVKQL